MTKGKSNNYKGKARTKKPFTKREEEDPKSTTYGKQQYNDASWYNAKDQLMKDVASLSFNTPLGNTQSVDAPGIEGSTYTKFGMSLPGILSIYTVPAISPSRDGSSVINIAAKNLYSYVRHQNSGHANYDSPDLMLYILAMDSVYSMISWMQSLYGTAMVTSQTNRYLGDALLEAKGARAADIRNNLANFRSFINQYIIKASAFCVPTTMSLFKRHFWMFSNSFKDEATTKSQLYCYVPAFLYQYNLDTNNVGFLDPIALCAAHNGTAVESKVCSLLEIESVANALLDALTWSEDINIMSGDILKAYGRENLWKMDLIPEGYGVFPVYSEEILDQIHNTMFVGRRPVKGSWGEHTDDIHALDITQRTTIGDGALLYSPKFVGAQHLGWDQVLDIHTESPTPEEVMVSTRNMVSGTVYTGSADGYTNLETCGSDICLFAREYQYVNGELTGQMCYFSANANMIDVARILNLSKFNKFPRFYTWNPTGTLAPNATPTGICGEIDNFTVINKVDLQKLHDTAMLSMLGVPTLGLVG